jgi:ribosomal protein L40E
MARSESIKKPKLTGECRKCTEKYSPYARCIESSIFRRVSACNLFLHIIISWYMALFESIEMPKLAEKGRKCTEKDCSYARYTGSTIFRRVSACNLFLHIIISCYMACPESIKKPKLTGECRKCTEQDSPHAR